MRIYPIACTSAYCGKTECPETCSNLPGLREFKAWKEGHAAEVTDPIWCPLAYTATK